MVEAHGDVLARNGVEQKPNQFFVLATAGNVAAGDISFAAGLLHPTGGFAHVFVFVQIGDQDVRTFTRECVATAVPMPESAPVISATRSVSLPLPRCFPRHGPAENPSGQCSQVCLAAARAAAARCVCAGDDPAFSLLQLFWLELGLRRSDFVIGPLSGFRAAAPFLSLARLVATLCSAELSFAVPLSPLFSGRS
ncbi:hypothetical protein MESS2_1640033 [Mesorhizobium metallidurans STM 2683]|uniref:Uncharacterized protein n=1 Tax=Mesorhizobium metallidurans STM 2683 TaxID=1297569 RepID=M5ENF3_9HYPH|nr:hypothetical protein MESS2_1640033 [Mesorhizobium metallidurans STM 2683]